MIFTTLGYSGEVSLRSKVDKALATTKDEILFSIELKMPKSLNLTIPDLGEKILGLRILESEDNIESLEGNVKSLKSWYKLQADVSGSYIIPSVNLSYFDEKNKEQKNLKSAEIFIEVKSSFSEEGEHKDIKGLKPIYKTPFPYIYLFILLVLVLLIVLIFYFIRKRSAKPIEEVQESLDIIYFKRLKGMKLELETKEQIKRTYFDLSEILKGIFEYRFSFPASDLTLQESRRKLKKENLINENHKEKFLELLDRMELVKYANVLGDHQEAEGIRNSLLEFLKQTKPKTEEGEV